MNCEELSRVSRVITVLTVSCASIAFADGGYDVDASRPAETILPPAFLTSGAYEIDETAEAENLFYRFSVQSNFGLLQISSIAMLRRRLGEVVKLEELQRVLPDSVDGNEFVTYGDDDVFSDALGTAWRIRRPKAATANVTSATPLEDDETESEGDKPSIQWRTAAARVGLDPYSSFPPVQAALVELSNWLGTSRFPTSVSAVPAARVFEPRLPLDESFEFELATVVKNSTSSELRSEMTRLLNDMAVELEPRVQFMNNAAYTESDRYRLLRLLTSVAELSGKSLLVAAAATAETEVDGLAFLNYIRLVSAYNHRVAPLVSILGITRYPALVSARGVGVLALPIDYLPWTERTSTLAAELVTLRDQRELRGFTVLLLGKPTARARARLDELDVKVIDGISL